jgi:hypothetical protein
VRLWSLHPKYLDTKGLLGLWREALLAQKVLLGETKGYKNHPQLIRFKNREDPILYIGTYLYYVYLEGERRGYNFDKSKIIKYDTTVKMPVTSGQIEYEFKHLLKKLKNRDPEKYNELKDERQIEPNPIFYIIKGGVEFWEKVNNNDK